MSYWRCDNEAPTVYMFVGDEPWEVMHEAADFLREAKDRGEYLTSWTVSSEVVGDPTEPVKIELKWYGTLVTNGAGYVAPWHETTEGQQELAAWERELLAEDDPNSEYSAWLADVQDDVYTDIPGSEVVEDGFGNAAMKCLRADCDLQVVRPGKFQCSCEDEGE